MSERDEMATVVIAQEPVTGELRRAWTYVDRTKVLGVDGPAMVVFDHSTFCSICGSIDALHSSLEDENGRLMGVLGTCAALPRDANGEVIRVGDLMRYVDRHLDVNHVGTFRVESMQLLADGSWMLMDDGPLHDHAPQHLVHASGRRELLRELVEHSMGVEAYRDGVAVLEVDDELFDEFLDEHPELLGGDE